MAIKRYYAYITRHCQDSLNLGEFRCFAAVFFAFIIPINFPRTTIAIRVKRATCLLCYKIRRLFLSSNPWALLRHYKESTTRQTVLK